MDKYDNEDRPGSATSITKSNNNQQLELHDQFAGDIQDMITTIPFAQSRSLPTRTSRHETLSSLERYQPRKDLNQCNSLEKMDQLSTDLPSNYNIDDLGHDNNKNIDQETQELNELVLSQRMGSLTTDTTDNNESSIKEIQAEVEKIPIFLTKRHNSFKQILYQAKSLMTSTTIDIGQLREIAMLIYKITIIQTYHLLWTAYLKSGRGELITSSEKLPIHLTTISVWPKDITSVFKLNNTTNSNEIYSNFVNQHLGFLGRRLNICQTELHSKVTNICGYSLTVQKIIETYIEKHLGSFRLKTEHQIELLHYDYHIRALKIEYVRHNPNQYQVEIMKKICQSKYEQETSEQECQFLKQQIDYYNSPSHQSLEHAMLAQAITTMTGTIENVEIRQQFFNQYKDIALQARSDLLQIYTTVCEEEKEDYKKKFEENVKNLYKDDRFIDGNRNLSLVLIQIIDQRCEKISERIKCVYKFKVQSTLL